MKLSVSTLGCPEWTLSEIIARVKAFGYEGVELRGIGPDLDLTKSPDFSKPTAVAATRRAFAEAGLEICCVDSSAQFTAADPKERARNAEHAQATIDLAAALGAPAIRVFGGTVPEGISRSQAIAFLVENLAALGDYAASIGGVSVLLETHDAFSTGAQVAKVLTQVGHPQVAALWDLHHPYRHGESPVETYAALAPYLRMTHVKDSQPNGHYCLLGQGDVPIRQMLTLLHQGGYNGSISLEWEKRWIPELAEPEAAFPQYAAKLREYLAEL